MKSLRVRFSLLRWLWFAGLGLGLGTVCGTDGHDNGNSERPRSHRLIVELDSPPLAVDSATQPQLVRRRANALNWRDPALADRVANRRVEQDRVMARLVAVDPGLRRGDYVQANGDRRPLSYVLTFNGFTVETDSDTPLETLRANLAAMPGVKAVHYDYAYTPTMFASLPLIHATSAWAQIAGEITNAGAGIKVASMDGGVHHAGPMFGGAGYTYPPGYPVGGLGETNNNNGKIIASRAYFRDWDPPVDGDEFAWPGPAGTSHGVHTAGTMAGNPVAASYLDGPEYDISGVAPAAWIMSYKVFYGSVDDDGSFYAAEGLAALEDILADGAQVLNNSWGSGPYARDDFDPLGIALRNLAAAGTFISFSAGNDGPERGTLDHAASEYITVASLSTESGGFSAGQLWVDAPGGPTNIPFSIGEFGASWPDHPTTMVYAASALIDPGNACGCSPWPDGAFEGHCALILRGTCDFSAKAYEAQQAGARALIVYNHESGGNSLVTMGAGSQGDLVDIPVAFIGHADGLTLVNWAAGHPDASLSVHFGSSQAIDGTPDIIADSSSRGPGIGNVLKPDIAAPGVNILSQGYGTGAGEAKHLDYGPASGTSMAAPHVAGAAALLRQLHPDWSNADIKSAIMNTARFLDIYIDAGRTQLAQPLDMGAGCLDLARAVDPGLLLDPPSLSFGQIDIGQTPDPIVIQARNVGDTAETYVLQTLCTTGGPGQITAWNALSVTPASLTLSAGQTTTITARLHTASAQPGDLQGFLVFSGAVHRVHMPAWGAIAASQTKDVLLLDFDASSAAGGPADYRPWYTNTLNALGWSYDELDVYQNYVPPVVELLAYRAVILFTGDNGVAYDSMLYESDVTRLVEFANQGGLVMIMGQAAYATIPDAESVFGLFHVADSVSDGAQPASLIQPAGGAPLPAGFLLDPRPMGDSAGNQTSMNAIDMLWDRDYIDYYPYVRWLEYDDQLVAFAHRDQPVLGRAGVSIPARFVVASFGLEGLNDQNPAAATRRNWLQYIWDWAFDEPAVTLSAAPLGNHEFRLTATLSNTAGTAAQTRWRFGNCVGEETIATTVDYTYAASGIYTAQVEVLNSLGNRAVAGLTVTNVVETYTEWADALDIPLDRREYGDDPFSNGVPNLIAYATGIAPDSSGRTPLAIGLSNGLPFLVVPWRTNIETGTAFVAECSTNLADSAAWLADDTLSWQSWPLGSNRVEHRGWVSTNAMPAQKTYRLRFQKGD